MVSQAGGSISAREYANLTAKLNNRTMTRAEWKFLSRENRLLNNAHPNAHGHSIRNVNPGYKSVPGRTHNCPNCVVATDLTLSGRPATALPGTAKSPAEIATYFGKTVDDWLPTNGVRDMEQIMGRLGPGTRGVVYGYRGTSQEGHVFNVINQRNVIKFIDGQSGGAARLTGYKEFHLLITSPLR